MENNQERPHVVIDIGSSYMKCGLSGEAGPRGYFVVASAIQNIPLLMMIQELFT